MQLPGRFKLPEPDQKQRAVLHDPTGKRLQTTHTSVPGTAAVRHSGRGKWFEGVLRLIQILRMLVVLPYFHSRLTVLHIFYFYTQKEIDQKFVPYIWIIAVSSHHFSLSY